MMTITQATNILNKTTVPNLEQVYEEFYIHCQSINLLDKDADILLEYIITKFNTEPTDPVKSYCFLFINALLDSAKITSSKTLKLQKLIIYELKNLINFKVLDDKDNYIHYISHIIYCAESLSKQPTHSEEMAHKLVNSLLAIYLRADTQFGFNEDILLAEFTINRNLPATEIKNILTQLSFAPSPKPQNIRIAAAKQTNKRNLHMAMLTLNTHFKSYDTDLFNDATSQMAKQLFD